MSSTNEGPCENTTELFRLLVDNARDHALFTTDQQGIITSWNVGVRNILGYDEEEWIGQSAFIIFTPEDRAQNAPEQERERAKSQGVSEDIRWHLKKDGSRFWAEGSLTALYDDSGVARGFGKILRDATARKRTEAALREAEAELRHHTRSYSALVDGAADSLVRYSRDLRFLFVNPAFEEYTGLSREQVLGKTYREAGFPEESIAVWEPTLRQVFQTGEPLRREVTLTRPSDGQTRLFERVILPEFDPSGTGEVTTVLTFSRDITERKQAERRERFVAELMERIRSIPDPEEALYETVKQVGEFAAVNRCLYAEIDEDTEILTVHQDFVQGEGVASIMGAYPLYSFGPPIVESLRAGNVTRSQDTEADERLAPEYRATFRMLGFRAFLCVPLHKEGKWVAILVLHSALPRVWTQEEAELLTRVAEQTWLAVENARLYRAMHEEVEERRAAERLVTEAYALERARAEREMLLSNVSRVLSASLDYEETLTAIARLIVPRFADWCGVDLIDTAGALQRVAVEHVDPRKVAWGWELHRRYPTRLDAPRGLSAVLRTGNSEFVPRITEEMITTAARDAEHLRLLREVGFTSVMIVPLIAGGVVLGALTFVSSQESGRIFRDEDLQLAEELGRRAALAIENARLFRETRLRAEREHLLNEISHAVRDADLSPEEIQARAIALLGKALGLDRCYFASYDPVRPVVRIGKDWHRDDIPSLMGEHPLPALAETSPVLKAEITALREQTMIYADLEHTTFAAETRAVLKAHGLYAMIGIVVKGSGGVPVASLRAAMVDTPRAWSEDEIVLVQSVATLVRTAIESARLQQRERNIAQQLQEALQPSGLASPPGLALKGFYKPALAEAGVGGDFWDVYPARNGFSALCCGDLSGKGLAAASQVATVRNMVRFVLYSDGATETLAQAIRHLNEILVEHGLLTGFATLFIGLYRHETRELTYVNCGQEPGLICRASTGEIEELGPTGPVLGGFEAGRYEQRTVTLLPGDVLALFTDGMTEVGPSRREFLEMDGVKRLLRSCIEKESSPRDPRAILESLVEGVDRYARGGARDDVALLVGVVDSQTVQTRENKNTGLL